MLKSLLVSSAFIGTLYACSTNQHPKQTIRAQSFLEIFSLDSGTRTIIYQTDENFEAPNWSRDDHFWVFNMNG
jgi:hypothetical protein